MKNTAAVKIPDIIRVDLDPVGVPGVYVLIIPDPAQGTTYRDFHIRHTDYPDLIHMFGVFVDTDADAVELALTNGPDYVKLIQFDDE